MNANFVITISRSSGSGGNMVAKRVAELFGISFYDKEILSAAAEHSGMNRELFEVNDEKPSSSLLYSVVVGKQVDHMPINQKLFMAQFETIQKLAEKGSCVILGRCADYALRDHPNLISVFVHAPLEHRIARTMELNGVDEKKARAMVSKTDKNRSNYYSFYSGRRWGDLNNYHLAIDSSAVGIEGCAETIKAFAETKLRFSGVL
ncbi:MAG: cytidylate kinase-like family protein [Clostridiales bacterium]|jgi:cytidylate kinase|nr:cytidylate kinase-like family protein [Clostridiales bacterium]